jgi:transcriptional regulator with XRE-family HTH domain
MARRFAHEKLATLRGRKTQTDLAAALRGRGFGTTQTTVSRWEAGQEPRAAVLPVLAHELGVTVDELFVEDDGESRTVTLAPNEYAMLSDLMARLAQRRTESVA